MTDYETIQSGSLYPRGFTMVARADGSAIVGGNVNYFLKALTGTNAGLWWQISDNTWQATETANAMNYESADAEWTLVGPSSSTMLDASPFSQGVAYIEYAKESGNLHVPQSRRLVGDFTPNSDSTGKVSIKMVNIRATGGAFAGRPGGSFTLSFSVSDNANSALNASPAPTATLRRNGTNDGTVIVSVNNNATGDYTVSGTIPATYSGGDVIEVVISATVSGVAGKAIFGLGQVERQMADSPLLYLTASGTSYYVSTTGNDGHDGLTAATAFLTTAHAIGVAIGGDIINIAAGTYALGNAVLNLPDCVSLVGAGQRDTIITSTADLLVSGCIVHPGNGSIVSRLSIVGVGTGVFQGPFGFRQDVGQAETSNWVLDDCYLSGDSDGLYLHSASNSAPPVRGILRNVVARTLYDTCNIFNNGSAWDIQIDFEFCNFRADGPSIVGANAFTSRACAVGIGKARLFGGSFEASGSGASNIALSVGNSTTVECYGTILKSSGTGALDINNSGNAIVSGVKYDPAKTSGTITVRPIGAMRAPAQSLMAGTGTVVLDATQPNYAPAKAGDGMTLTANGLDAIAVTDPGAPANVTTWPKMLVAVWRSIFGKSTLTATQLKTYADDGTTVNSTSAVSDDGTTQTKGKAS